ncbi:MAG: tyrosine-protein phosphatase [Acidimicrobiia bacterium]
MGAPFDRFIVVDGCHNVRDLGGYTGADGRIVRWGRVYRADGPNDLTPAGRDVIRSLGIATVIDFRSPEEHGEHPFLPGAISMPVADAPNADWSADAVRTGDDLAERYYDMATTAQESLRTTFHLMATRLDRPLLFHCAAGKDRTGIVAALTLSVAGVPDEVIADDYELSHEPTQRRRAVVMARDPQAAARYGEFAPIVLTAHAPTMRAFMALVRQRHGDACGLLTHLGVTAAEIDQIVAHLLVDPAAEN